MTTIMPALLPTLIADLAKDVYALTKTSSLEKAIKDLNKTYNNLLMFSEETTLKAKTGGPWFIKCQTAFGFTLLGQGALKGHAFFLFRGTKYLADWLTNLNISASRSTTGQPVHDGFNLSFKTMIPMLKEFMNVVATNKITDIHCIGHSLGGALATLCSEWIRGSYNRKTYLYTFGSPRVGLYDFASYCTANIGTDRFFRAYHKTDIVPCIPMWPFIHTPNAGENYYLPSPGIMPMAEYHGMDKYIESVRGQSWTTLAKLKDEKKTDEGIVQWLKMTSPMGLTIAGLELLSQALMYVLRKCLGGAAPLMSNAVGTSFTLMDQLAYILSKGVDLSENVTGLVQQFLRKIMLLLGMKDTLDNIDITRAFIRELLLRLQQKVNEFTQTTLNKILVEGRAV